MGHVKQKCQMDLSKPAKQCCTILTTPRCPQQPNQYHPRFNSSEPKTLVSLPTTQISPKSHHNSQASTQAPKEATFQLSTRTRRAATSYNYNLSAKWDDLNQYLAENDDSTQEKDNNITESESDDAKRSIKRIRKRREEETSEELSDSDEYCDEFVKDRKMDWKQRYVERGPRNSKPQRKRVQRLARADMEVIGGQEERKIQAGKKAASRTLTKEAVARLMQYISQKTNWNEAAGYVYSAVESGGKKEGREQAMTSKVDAEAVGAQIGTMVGMEIQQRAVLLRKQWEEVLGRQILKLQKP